MEAAEIFEPLHRMFAAMEKMCIRTTEMRERYGRWNVPVSRAECTVIWFALGVKPEPGAHWPRFPVPNVEHNRRGADSSRSVRVDGPVGPQDEE